MLWICLHLPLLPLEVFTRGSPGANSRPVALVQNQQVACCNDAAKAQGIVAGMSATTAGALASSLLCLEKNSDKERLALRQLAQWAYSLTPACCIKPPADLLLEVGASLKLFQQLENITKRIDTDLPAQGFSYAVGLAHTPKAAWLVARHQPGAAPAWFDRQRQQLDMEQLNAVLAGVPLQRLDLPDPLLSRLHKPGFRVLADILPLPRQALGRRFGRDFLLHLDQLRGHAPDPQHAIEPEPGFFRQLDFMEPLHRTEALLFPMQRLLDELAAFLHARQLECPGFEWQLAQQDDDLVLLPIRLSRPHHDKQRFMALTRTRLEQLKLEAPVSGLGLRSDRFSRSAPTTKALFEEWRAQQQQSMELLLDTLNTRLKNTQIYGLEYCNEHVPELAWRRTTALSGANKGPGNTGHSGYRPTWLLAQPSPIRQQGDSLYWRGKLQLIIGPERIQSHWWDNPVQRDYFIAQHQDGGFYWIYLDIGQQRWFVHGIFA